MKLLESKCEVLNSVNFPVFMGERHYMIKFFKDQGLPDFISRFQDTVDGMLLSIDTKIDGIDQPIFITIDEKLIKKGSTHRRGGVHIDGYWIEELQAHGGGHRMSASGLDTGGGINWKTGCDFSTPESIVLASSVAASKGWLGEYENNVGEGGDCTHLDLSKMETFILQPNITYRGNVAFLHESIPVEYDTERTLIRLNIKNC